MGLEAVGKAASVTSGTINIVNPLELVRQVRSIYQNSIIATGVKISLFLNKLLVFREETLPDDEEKESTQNTPTESVVTASPASDDKHKHKHKKHKDKGKQKAVVPTNTPYTAVRYIGNVTNDSDVTFEYTISNTEAPEIQQLRRYSEKLTFQIQITYTKPTGWRNVRVITKQLTTALSREVVERNVDLSIIGLNAVKTAARMAQTGKVKEARNKLFAVQQMMKRCAKSDTQMEEFYNYNTVSKELDNELKSVENTAKATDTTAKILYRMKGASKTAFLAGNKKKEAVVKRKVRADLQEQVQRFGTVEQSY